MRTVTAAALLVAVVLAGCADSAPTEEDDDVFDGLEAEATDETGVIRGVVVDETIVPVPEATVTLVESEMETLTNENGAFTFSGLEPGIHIVQVSKAEYNTTQSSVTVEAGVDKPAVLKIQLPRDPSSLPYVQTFQFDGFIACSTRLVVIGFALCSAVGGFDDDFARNYDAEKTPEWIQSELIWRSTQPVGDELSFSITCLSGSPCPDGQRTIARHEGPSPLLLQINRTTSEEFLLGKGQPITVRVFAHGHSATDIPEEEVYDATGLDCLQWPVLFDGCIRFGGVGLVLDQTFTAYTHIYHGFLPEDGWRFSEHGAPDVPDE